MWTGYGLHSSLSKRGQCLPETAWAVAQVTGRVKGHSNIMGSEGEEGDSVGCWHYEVVV